MSLKTAVTIGIIGAATGLLLQLALVIGGSSFSKLLWENSLGGVVWMIQPACLLTFFVVLRKRQQSGAAQ
jgi:hypothetical protein